MSENRTKKPRLDPYTLLEKRIKELSKKLSEMEVKTKRSLENLQDHILQLNAITHSDMWLLDKMNHFPREGTTSNFDSFVKTVKERDIALGKIKMLGTRLPEIEETSAIMDAVILYAHFWKIPFETLASYLIGEFGKREVKRLVKKETVLEHYGKDVIPIWEKVLEE